MRKWIIAIIAFTVLLSSCGGGGAEAGCDDLGNSCVYVSLEPQTTNPVIQLHDTNGDKVCDFADPYEVTARIRVEPINPSFPTSNVQLVEYRLSFYPELLPQISQKLNSVTIQPGQEKETLITVFSSGDIINLYENNPNQTNYTFQVILNFRFIEENSGKDTWIRAYLTVNLTLSPQNCY